MIRHGPGARTWLLLALVIALWCFPRLWYTQTDASSGYFWLAENQSIPGWSYRDEPISKAAEAVLAANHIVNGEFAPFTPGNPVRVFSAKRYGRGQSEYDMFSHTPDRCWTSVGWRIEPVQPACLDIAVHGLTMRLERRVFALGTRRELVYFGALVGGQPLPYRLDQYLGIGERRSALTAGIFGKALGALDLRMLRWPWESFLQRRPLTGPKQFIRISTPLVGATTEAADQTLRDFLPHWLTPVDYQKELKRWEHESK